MGEQATPDAEREHDAPTHDHSPQAHGSSIATPALSPMARQLLQLQRTAGNRAVNQMLIRRELDDTEPDTESDTDRFTKMGKASKIGGAISQAAKYSGVDTDQHTLKPSDIVKSSGEPEQLVKGAGSNWSAVKKKYVSDEPTMRKILQYRIYEVGRIYKLVIAQMWEQNHAVRKFELAKPEGERDMTKVFQLNDLQFSMMGSTDLTSDYDVSFDHIATKPWIGAAAVKLFNQKFRAKWKKESGTVFDTNVYTQGFMPQDMSNIPAGMPGAIENRAKGVNDLKPEEGSQEEKQKLLDHLKAEAEKAKTVRKQAAQKVQGERGEVRKLDPETQKAVFVVEDVMSMVKLRKFMSEDEWRNYRVLLLARIPVKAHEATVKTLDEADKTYKVLDKELENMKADLRTQKKKRQEPIDEGDLELEASNRLYEKYLDKALNIVQANKGKLEGAALVKWTEEQSTALYFANEAYHTSGPVESTVIGQQMGIAMSQTSEQHLQAINEQSGFVVEQHHAAHGDDGKFLWKSSKYVDRICSIVDTIKKENSRVGEAKHYAVLKPLSAELLKIKKGPGTDSDKSELSLKKLTAMAKGSDVKAMVLELNADLNQKLRRSG